MAWKFDEANLIINIVRRLKCQAGISVIVSIVVVVWTFTLSISVYCLGKLDQRFYGIKLTDIIQSGTRTWKMIIICFTVLIEMFFLFLAVLSNKYFTVIILGFLQFLSMFYAVLMIIIETSKLTVIKRIENGIEKEKNLLKYKKSDFKNYNNWTALLTHMLNNIDYANKEEYDILMKLFKKTISFKFSENWCIIYEIMHDIFSAKTCMIEREDFVQQWLIYIDDEGDNLINIKKGIFSAIIELLYEGKYDYLLNSLSLLKNDYDKMIIWCVACNIYFEKLQDQHWRSFFTKKIRMLHLDEWNKSNIDMLIIFLRDISNKLDEKYKTIHNSMRFVNLYFDIREG